MEEQLIVTLERDASPEVSRVFVVEAEEAFAGVVSNTVVRSRITCGDGCGFVVNVN